MAEQHNSEKFKGLPENETSAIQRQNVFDFNVYLTTTSGLLSLLPSQLVEFERGILPLFDHTVADVNRQADLRETAAEIKKILEIPEIARLNELLEKFQLQNRIAHAAFQQTKRPNQLPPV